MYCDSPPRRRRRRLDSSVGCCKTFSRPLFLSVCVFRDEHSRVERGELRETGRGWQARKTRRRAAECRPQRVAACRRATTTRGSTSAPSSARSLAWSPVSPHPLYPRFKHPSTLDTRRPSTLMPSTAVSLGALVAALVAGWFLFLRDKGDSASSSPAASSLNGSAAAKAPANGVVDTGRDFVASLKLSVSRRSPALGRPQRGRGQRSLRTTCSRTIERSRASSHAHAACATPPMLPCPLSPLGSPPSRDPATTPQALPPIGIADWLTLSRMVNRARRSSSSTAPRRARPRTTVPASPRRQRLALASHRSCATRKSAHLNDLLPPCHDR